MTDIYLHFLFAHYGLYGNAPVGVPLRSPVDAAGARARARAGAGTDASSCARGGWCGEGVDSPSCGMGDNIESATEGDGATTACPNPSVRVRVQLISH